MTITDRDRRALVILGGAVALILAIYFWPEPKIETIGAAPSNVEQAAARLQRVRQEAAQFPLREEMRAKAAAELANLEKGLIPADTIPQAQAQMLQVVRRVARSQSPPLELKSADFGTARSVGEHYAELIETLTIECQIEQLINFMADLSSQPELLAVDELHIAATNNKQKSINVRMTVSGLVRGSLLRPAAGGRS